MRSAIYEVRNYRSLFEKQPLSSGTASGVLTCNFWKLVSILRSFLTARTVSSPLESRSIEESAHFITIGRKHRIPVQVLHDVPAILKNCSNGHGCLTQAFLAGEASCTDIFWLCNSPVNCLVMSDKPVLNNLAAKEEDEEEEQEVAVKPPKPMVFEDLSYKEKIFENLNKLRKNKHFCDVILLVGATQDVKEIHAHRAVLASASRYFFDLFTAENKGNRNQFRLNGHFEFEAFQKLVDYAYTGRLEIPHNKVKTTYAAATKLRMFTAAKQCGQYLVDNLRPDNCIGLRSMTGIASDPDLLIKVDNYIRNNIAEIAKSKELLALPTIPVELLQNSMEEKNATNVKHLGNMVLDWIRKMTDEDVTIAELTEKVNMLYLNLDHTLHDCSDIENGDLQDSEVIQDYKKLSRRISVQKNKSSNSRPSKPKPAKPRQFLFTKSDSTSSLSSVSDDEEKEWKVIATTVNGEHSVLALAMAFGKLAVLSVVQRIHTPSHSPLSSRNTSVEKISAYASVPPMSSARCAVGTAELKGKLLVCGGYDRGECLKTVEAYDLSTNKWTMMEPMKVPRGRFDITVVSGKIYAVGGCDGQKDLSSAEYWDPSINCWKQLPNLPFVRSYAGVCSVDKKIYVIGGWNVQRGVTRCDVYDTEQGTWSSIASLSSGRYQAGVKAMGGEVYAVGGCDSWNCLNSVEKYSPLTNTWMYVAPLHTARRGCGVAIYNGKLYAVGGHDGVHSLCSVEIYDPETDTWCAGPPLTCCRANVGVSVVGNFLFAVGGFNGKTFLNTVEYLDPQNNEWTTFVAKEQSTVETNGLDRNTVNDSITDGILGVNAVSPNYCNRNNTSESGGTQTVH